MSAMHLHTRSSRLIAVAAIAWTTAWFSAASRAADQAKPASAANPHRDLSLFTHSDNCVACHNNLAAANGEDVSIGTAWRATMMANSARDPYWQASVRRETIDHPSHAADIQDECAACHMPMTQRIAKASGVKGEVFSHLPIARDQSEWQRLAGDGISCTVCHQISPDTLGTPASFNANFVMKPTPPDGMRVIFGNYDIDPGRRRIMHSVTGFQQEAAPHIKQSELCATCHTLITQALGPDGAVIGQLHEQMNFQEWQHSDYAKKEQRSCQSCHMPAVEGPIRIASVLGDLRDSLARHAFVGGNAHMLRLLNRFRNELAVTAPEAEMEATARATIRQLQQDTATIRVSTPQLAPGRLAFEVEVTNLTGHKFPTGYPSRRAWLHVTVRDGRGVIAFESGAITDAASITGNDNDRDAARHEPHYEEISSADQVQIYESILGDRAGAVTTGLLTATQYLKDNRLLPRGFDKATAALEIGVFGAARDDRDFAGGGDRVRYLVPVSSVGPYRVDVELRYQSIGFRWASNLEPIKAEEPARFVSYYKATSAGSSVVVATATVTVESRTP
jgi:nitrate/TMAO reductase-like tetraheme cytochrome c subunit